MKTKIAGLTLVMILSAVAVWAVPEDARFSGGSYDGWDRQTMTNAMGLGTLLVTLSSGTNQVFDWFLANPTLASLTISAEDPQSTITNGITMHVSVPTAWGCRFDTNSAVAYSGRATAKVTTPSFSDDGRRLLIPVTTDFVASDTLTVSGLKLVNLQLVPTGASRLELDFTGDGVRDTYDLYTVQVQVQWSGGSYDGWDRQTTVRYTSLAPRAGTVLMLW